MLVIANPQYRLLRVTSVDFFANLRYNPSLPLKKLKKASQSRNKQRKSVRYDVKTAYSEFDKIAPQSYSYVDIIDL